MSVRALLGVSFSAFLYPVNQFLLGGERIIHGLYRCAEAGFFGLVQFGDADAPLAHILLCVRLPPCPELPLCLCALPGAGTDHLREALVQRGKLAVIPFNDSIEATTAEIMKALEA